MRRAILLAVSFSCVVLAQQQPPPQPGQIATESKSDRREEAWKRMSVKEKLQYDARHVLDTDNLVFAGIGAGFDQLRDRPGQWGQGLGGYAERYGSHFGQYLVQRSIMFPVQAIDHEDTRYLRSRRDTIQGRVGDAFLHTIWRRSDDGE